MAVNGDAGATNSGMGGMRYLRDVEEILPEFDPVKKNISITRWVEIVEETKAIYGWTDLEVRHYALTKMVGVARKWRESLRPQPATWAEWKVKMKATFPSTQSTMSIRLEAQNYRRRHNQEVTEYVYEKLALCNKAEMSEDEIKEWMVSGLGNDRYRDHLGPLTKFSTLFDLIEAITHASLYIKEEQKTDKKIVQCHKCKKTGHYARECTSGINTAQSSQVPRAVKREVTCFKCNQVGHYARECQRAPPSSGNVQSTSVLVVNNRSANCKYFKNALINNAEVRCYVDLGSQTCALRKDIADEIGFVYNVEDGDVASLSGYGGGVVKPIGVGAAVLEIDNVKAKVLVQVVPSEVQEIPLIVGHPYTEQSHIIILKTATEFRITSNGLGEFEGLEAGTPTRTPI